jgi:hypothetical protein
MFDDISFEHRRNGALVDTNLFLLLLVGRYDPGKLDRFRATQRYNDHALAVLQLLVSRFRSLLTTPQVVTEIDNLSRQTSKAEWSAISHEFATALGDIEEQAFSSRQLVAHPLHSRFGIADCSIIEMAARGILIVTDDLPLTTALEVDRRAVVNLSRYLGRRQ